MQIYEILLGFTHHESSYTQRYQYPFKHNRTELYDFVPSQGATLPHVWHRICLWRRANRLRPATMDDSQALNLLSFRVSDVSVEASRQAYTQAINKLVDLGLLARYSRGIYLINPWYCNCLSMVQWEYVIPQVWRLRSAPSIEVIDPEYYVPEYEPML